MPPRLIQRPLPNGVIDDERIHFVPTPSEHQKVVFNIVLSPKDVESPEVRWRSPHNPTVFGPLELRNRRVWLLAFCDTFSEEERAKTLEALGKYKLNLNPGGNPDDVVRASFMIMWKADSTPDALADIQYGYENVVVLPGEPPADQPSEAPA